MLMKSNGIMLNTLDAATDKYIEKSKIEKCEVLAATALKWPATVAAAAARRLPKSATMKTKANLTSSLPHDLSWNEFQREAVGNGYVKSTAELANAGHQYKRASGAATARPSSTRMVKTGSKLTPAQRQAALDLSQNAPGLAWNEFQQHDCMRAMIDRLAGNIVNKNAILAGVWRQYQADQQPAAAPQAGIEKYSTQQRFAFAAGDKAVWMCHDSDVLEGEIGVCTGKFDEDGDPELQFTIGGWVGFLPTEELEKVHPGARVPSGSAFVSATASCSSLLAAAGADKSRAPSSSSFAAMRREAAARFAAMRTGTGKITEERSYKIQIYVRSTVMTLPEKVAAIATALRTGRKDMNLQDFSDVVVASGLPVAHFTPEMFRQYWKASSHTSSKAGITSPTSVSIAPKVAIPVPITAPDKASSLTPKVRAGAKCLGWTTQEEHFLVQHVMEHGPRRWGDCAAELGTGRTGSACAQHYRIFLKSTHQHKERSIALQPQPRAVLEAASTKPAAISAACVPNSRSQASDRQKGAWSEKEDAALVEHIENKGVGSWPVVAAAVSAVGAGRSSSSCRSHYFDIIAPQQRAKPAPPLISADSYASLPSGLDWRSFQNRIRVFGNNASTY
eukprot:COSAG02_NODE_10786_length_1858_cov_1.570210_1_plen_618_part_11